MRCFSVSVNYKQIYAIKKQNEERLLAVNPGLPEKSGIYFLTRTDEDGFKYAYIGQAKKILSRLVQHMSGYQHIDLSIKSHKLYSDDNPYGWKVNFLLYPESELDSMEQVWIKKYAENGFQLRNKTSGSQGEGKRKIDDYKPAKGYRDGLEQGRKNVSKELAHLFELHLDVTTKKNPPTFNQQKALQKFEDFLNYHKQTEE